MINKTLFVLIQEKLKRGLDKDTMSKELLSQGWGKEEIDECFREIENNNKTFKKIIKVTITALVLVAIFLFIPFVPYKHQVYCIAAPCPQPIEMITLPKFISSKTAQVIEKAKNEYISPEQMAQIKSLMQQNEKSLSGLKPYKIQNDELGMVHIRFYVYKMAIKTGEKIYHFKKDGKLSSITE